jgi:hypothetical protein
MSDWLKTPKGQDERNTLLYEWVTEDTKGVRWTSYTSVWAFTHTEVYYVHLAPLVSSVTHSYRSILRSSVSHSLIQKCITFISQSLTHKEVYYGHLAPLVSSVTHSYDERSTLLYEWVTEDTKGARWYTSVWVSDWRHQRGKMNVIHFCMSEWLRSSCSFGVFSHSLIQKYITFISQSLTHTEVNYVHLAPWVSSVTHSYRSVLRSSCPWVSSVTHSYKSVLRSSFPFGGVTEDTKGARWT